MRVPPAFSLWRLRWISFPVVVVLLLLGLEAGTSALASTSTSYTVHKFTTEGYDGVSPADPSLAVGPTYIVETINTSMTVYTKAGQETSHREFGDLFAPATNVFCADPRVIYWSWSNRYAIACTDTGNQTTRLAVSASGNPNGAWVTYSTGPNTAVDQPKVEATKDKLVVAGNTTINGVSSSVFWVYQLSDVLSGVANPRVSYLTTPRGQYQAVVQLTPTAPAYLVQAYPGSNDIFLTKIRGTPATHVSSMVSDLGVYPLTPPSEPSVPGGSIGGGYLDGRITSAVYEVTSAGAKIIQYSGMAECGSRVCDSNARITLTSSGPVSSYVKTLAETSYDDTYGAVTVDGAGRAFEAYSRSNGTTTPQAAIVTPGFRTVVAKSVSGTTVCHTGVTPPCDERWGDYLGATQDPSNREELWFVGLYQTASGDDGWTTAISSVTNTV
ncbi:MAG: hypothetical protein M3P18_05600 [Actinomycetota bacterium]|nr:hypothetical protein [Actinomycetota bacterium]